MYRYLIPILLFLNSCANKQYVSSTHLKNMTIPTIDTTCSDPNLIQIQKDIISKKKDKKAMIIACPVIAIGFVGFLTPCIIK